MTPSAKNLSPLPLFPDDLGTNIQAIQPRPESKHSGNSYVNIIGDRFTCLVHVNTTFEISNIACYGFPVQLSFEFVLEDNIRSISNYIPRRRHPILDRNFAAFAAKDWRIQPLAAKLHQAGFIYVGDVVQLTEDKITALTGASPAMIERIRRALQAASLDLGMTPLGWRALPSHRQRN